MPSKFKPALAGKKSKLKIKRGDQVIVIAGKSKGTKGRVLRIIADKNRVLVEGAQMIKKHMKPNPQKQIAGGILEQEATIHISNVMLLDSDGNKTRVGYQTESGKKTRIARSNGVTIPEKKTVAAKK
ncbi:MAG: 50S ribosomal protein L24 [Acidobacteriota bacterium]|nr:50S ribosomal protein L24 [Acidobacteriota bacterium]